MLAQRFADAMAELASGVVVITAARADGRPTGLAATSVCSYSITPPSLLAAIADSARSHPVLLDAPRFGAHILRAEQEEVAAVFAGRGEDKFSGLDWGWEQEVPRIADGLAFLACRREAVFHHGDHSILIGAVERVDVAGGAPLLYLRRRMGRLRQAGTG
jgi:flavin reductase (DIM6/NTAB) family NADH-FMN oxidoreductase RutF